jgi:hypothetical protein
VLWGGVPVVSGCSCTRWHCCAASRQRCRSHCLERTCKRGWLRGWRGGVSALAALHRQQPIRRHTHGARDHRLFVLEFSFNITRCRYGRRAQVTTARNLKDYAAIVDALVSQPNVLREYRQYAPVVTRLLWLRLGGLLMMDDGTGSLFSFCGVRYLSEPPAEQAPLFDTKAWVDDLSACDISRAPSCAASP